MELLKKLFGPKYGTGALESPIDPRNIALATFQEPVAIPDEYRTELPPVEDQGSDGICVGMAIHKVAELYIGNVNLSPRDLYNQCKEIDGIPDIPGTYPIIGAKVATKNGIATEEAYKTGNSTLIKVSRSQNKLAGYAFVDEEFGAICQAIYQNKAVCACFSIDGNWYKGIMTRVLKRIGLHYVVLNGFKMTSETLYGQNSWGIRWIGYIAGKLNPAIKAGQFEMKWGNIEGDIRDIIAFTYIPPQILDEATRSEYRFTKSMRMGQSGLDIKKLQERLKKEGYPIEVVDGKFGLKTFNAVALYQAQNGLKPDGIVGPIMRAHLNQKAMSLIPLWAKAIQDHEGYYSGSRSHRNNNPANFKLSTPEMSEYMKKLGATSLDKQNFVIFPDYKTGFNALCKFLEDACNGKLKRYKPTMTLQEFFAVYAPSFENDTILYSKTVAKKVGVTVDTPIGGLL